MVLKRIQGKVEGKRSRDRPVIRYINQIKSLTQMSISESIWTQSIENSGDIYPIRIIYMHENHDIRKWTMIKWKEILHSTEFNHLYIGKYIYNCM